MKKLMDGVKFGIGMMVVEVITSILYLKVLTRKKDTEKF